MRQRCEPLLLLRCIAVTHQDGIDRAVGHADGGAGAAITGGDFFNHQRQRQVVKVGAAPLFRHTDAVSTQRGQTFVRLNRKVVLFVPARGMWPQFGFGKVAYRVADHRLVLCEQHAVFTFPGPGP